MPSDIQIASNASMMIGHSQLSALSDHPAIAGMYLTTYRSLLTKRRWRFAMQKKALNRLATAPLNEFTYAFQLPSDWLAVSRVYPHADYEIFDDKIYSNHTSVEIDYLVQVPETKLPSYFVETLEFALATKFAIPITGNVTKAELYAGLYKDQLITAGFTDSQGRPPDPVEDSPFIAVRY